MPPSTRRGGPGDASMDEGAPRPGDYERIARAIAFIAERVGEQPTLEAVAAHVHLSPFHFQRLFCRWAGTSPKRFLQVLTVERAKGLLMARKKMSEPDAFRWIQRTAMDRRTTMRAVADAVVETFA
ncbi:MAG TPA: ANTAR domain-containing protein [Rhodocyclaceae bacterium]|nr:ANTAR domain-containing protein [Rhodocyclaceae bacterium]